MASSQVEVPSPSSPSPFGCVLRNHSHRHRDHNHRRWSNSNTNPNSNSNSVPNAAFQKDFNDFVHSISGQPINDNPDDLWVHVPSYDTVNKNDHATHIDKVNDDKWDDAPDGGDSTHRGASAPVTPTPSRKKEVSVSVTADIPNLCTPVSSLVRKWRDFETSSSTNNSPLASGNANANSSPRISRRVSDASGVGDHESVDSVIEWEFDRLQIDRPCSPARELDAMEKERHRVADIVKKLTCSTNEENNGDHGPESLVGVRTPSSDQSSPFSVSKGVSPRPRLRGRHAFNDLLMNMQRDRHNELATLVQHTPVSKFPQRGRIQAMLRVQFLRSTVEVNDARQLNSTSTQSKRLSQSAIMQLREKFKATSEPVSVDSNITDHKEMADNITPPIEEKMSNETIKDNQCEDNTTSPRTNVDVADNIEHVDTPVNNGVEQNADTSPSDVEDKTTILENNSIESPKSEDVNQEASKMLDILENKETNQEIKKDDDIEQNVDEKKHVEIKCNSLSYNVVIQDSQDQPTETGGQDSTINCEEDEANHHKQYVSESEHGWVSDVSHTQVGWEELHSDYEERQTDKDWIYDISRPRSEWEDLRQERYQEMLDPFHRKHDICSLLLRKNVSSFLSSGMRDTIDNLLMSRSPKGSHTSKFKKERITNKQEEEEKEKPRSQRYEKESEQEERYDRESESEEVEEDESRIEGSYEEESVEYADQMTPSLPSTEWNHNEASDDNSQIASASAASSSLQQNTSDVSYCPESLPKTKSSIEMELIYELRGQIAQLTQEMSQLRSSINSCMNMQLKLERSVKQEVGTALVRTHSGGQRRVRHVTQKKRQSKRICCICCEMQVDAMMYRCGHMCTCFKCAHEVQWNTGRCPVCQAPIIDIVRPYAQS